MLLVHHIVAGFQLHQVDSLAPAFRGFGLGRGTGAARQVAFGQQRDAGGRVDESVDGLCTDRLEPGDAGLVDRALESGERAVRGGGDRHLQAANAMRPGREASTVKLVSRHTSKSR